MRNLLIEIADKVTGRRCSRCRHCRGGHCAHPSGSMFAKCWRSITRPGFEKKPPRYLKTSKSAEYIRSEEYKAVAQGVRDGLNHDLTPEEEYQLQKIRDTLQDAEDVARESGLVSED